MGGDIQHVNINYGGWSGPSLQKGLWNSPGISETFKGELLECFNKNHGYYVDNNQKVCIKSICINWTFKMIVAYTQVYMYFQKNVLTFSVFVILNHTTNNLKQICLKF